ncbi:MAG: hypothetical protein F6K22_17585 [Okeania sp. SIO2F4]|nr:hypothetical protein [Okeania sp. SIO2F4]NES04478.1 hypothetical protein [Okeania sp. SIO2F4]
MSEQTDSDRLHDLEDSLANFQVYSPEYLRDFMDMFLSGDSRESRE